MMTQLSVIIVNFNTSKLTLACLKSLYRFLPRDSQVIVVDNASTDDSVVRIKKHFPDVSVIINDKNFGFATANNIGIRHCQGKYILLLNSDTLITRDAFTPLIEFMDTHSRVGISSPRLVNLDGSIQPQGGSLPRLSNIALWMWFIDDLPLIKSIVPSYHQTNSSFFAKTRPMGWVSGTAMMLRRNMLDQIGLLDETIFMYGEDTELCFRAHQARWQIYLVADAALTHLNHGSGSRHKAVLGEYRGLLNYFHRHKPAWELPLLKLLLKSGALLRMIIFGKIMRKGAVYDTYQQAFRLA